MAYWAMSNLVQVQADLGLTGLDRACLPQLQQAYAESYPAIITVCRQRFELSALELSAILIGAASVCLPLLMVVCSLMSGANRVLMAIVFPPLTGFSALALAIFAIAQSALVVAACFLAGAHIFGSLAIRISIAAAVGGIVTSYILVRAAWRMTRPLEVRAHGALLAPAQAPEMFSFVAALAKKTGAAAPKNIILGLDPTFYVTSTRVRLADQLLDGQTLYLSAPLVRVMTRDELAAVIGHELGHFRGGDTLYSRRFAPVYVGLEHALFGMAASGGAARILAMPAISTLAFLHGTFSRKAAKVSRKRELEADKVGVECASASALASALMKAVRGDVIWGELQRQVVTQQSELQFEPNLSAAFARLAHIRLETPENDETLQLSMERNTAHPLDSHPPLAVRFEALGVKGADFRNVGAASAAESAAGLLGDVEEIERALTRDVHRLFAEVGFVNAEDQVKFRAKSAAFLSAHLILAADLADEASIARVEEIARKRVRDFDPAQLRATLQNPDQLIDLEAVLSVVAGAASSDGRLILREYAEEIVHSALHDRGRTPELLKRIKAAWLPTG